MRLSDDAEKVGDKIQHALKIKESRGCLSTASQDAVTSPQLASDRAVVVGAHFHSRALTVPCAVLLKVLTTAVR